MAPLAPAPFRVESRPAAGFGAAADDLLAVLGAAPGSGTRPGAAALELPQLVDDALVEVWRSRLPLARGRTAGIAYAKNGAVLFGHASLDEHGYASLAEAVRDAYQRMLAVAAAHGYPYVLRVWNVVPRINVGGGDAERYKQFCLGRHAAMERPGFEGSLPAATAVGSGGADLGLCFLAAADAGIPIENPRQVSAYRYPRCYGPKSPTFARAVLKQWGAEVHLYVSGTASVVGHATCHSDDLLAQLRETTRNIQALLEHAATRGWPSTRPSDLASLRVYVRHREHIVAVRDGLTAIFGPRVPVMYCHADLCRRDLLLEVEAFGALPSP